MRYWFILLLLVFEPLTASRYGNTHLQSRLHDPFIIIGIPKCGTHLLTHTISSLLRIPCDEGWDNLNPTNSHDLEVFNTLLNHLRDQEYIHKTGIPYASQFEEILLQNHFRWLFIYRDPRDAIISLLFHMENWKGNRRDFMYIESSAYDPLSIDEKISSLLTGLHCSNYLMQFYKPLMGWRNSPNGLAIRFEDLVGTHSAFSDEEQLAKLTEIATYLNTAMTKEEIEATAAKCYLPWRAQELDGIHYKRGQVGSWKLYFSDKHKRLFKEHFGAELIELGYEDDFEW